MQSHILYVSPVYSSYRLAVHYRANMIAEAKERVPGFQKGAIAMPDDVRYSTNKTMGSLVLSVEKVMITHCGGDLLSCNLQDSNCQAKRLIHFSIIRACQENKETKPFFQA